VTVRGRSECCCCALLFLRTGNVGAPDPARRIGGRQQHRPASTSIDRSDLGAWAGVPVELQMCPMARRAFDFRRDATPEEKIAARHARARAKDWLWRHLRLGPTGRCAE